MRTHLLADSNPSQVQENTRIVNISLFYNHCHRVAGEGEGRLNEVKSAEDL